MSVSKFNPNLWKNALPKLPGDAEFGDFGDTVTIEATGWSAQLTHSKYIHFAVKDVDDAQSRPDFLKAIMARVHAAMVEAAGKASVIRLVELEAYHSKRNGTDFIKGRFVFAGAIE